MRYIPSAKKMTLGSSLTPVVFGQEDIAGIRARIQRQQAVHTSTLEQNQELREDYIERQRRQRMKERHLAHFASQMHSIASPLRPHTSMAALCSPDSREDETSISKRLSSVASRDSGWPVPIEVGEHDIAKRKELRISRSAGQVLSNLPTLMSRKVDKISTQRVQNAAKAEREELKAQAQRMRTRLVSSSQKSSQGLAQLKKEEVIKQKRQLVEMRANRRYIDGKLELHTLHPYAEHEEASRPSTSHVDLRRYVAWMPHDAGQGRPVTRQNSNPDVPPSPTPLRPRSEQEHRRIKSSRSRHSTECASMPAEADLQQAHGHLASTEPRPRVAEERPVSAVARDQLLESSSSGINLTIQLGLDFLTENHAQQ